MSVKTHKQSDIINGICFQILNTYFKIFSCDILWYIFFKTFCVKNIKKKY